jgi:threonine/homoserine/homoserine lactone efflux protein
MSIAVTLGSLMAVHLAANASPGPNMLLVTQVAASASRAAGLRAALGLAAGATLWAAAAAAGLGVLSHVAWLQSTLRALGALYLVYLGARVWATAGRVAAATEPAPRAAWPLFGRGVATNLANPASLAFFGGIFAALLPPDLPLWVRLAAVAVIAADALLWYLALAYLFSAPAVRRGYARARRAIDRVMGGLLVLFGVRLLLSSR